MNVQNRIRVSLLALLGVFLGGTFGYSVIEDWSLADSLYMTLITISTVGFGEVRTLTDGGRLLTMGLIITSITVGGFALTNLTSYIISGQIVEGIRDRQMYRKIKKMKNHVILAGYGKLGHEIADELNRMKHKFCVIELDEKHASLAREKGYLIIQGDASRDDILEEAGVRDAYGLIAALTGDSANVMVTITAREMNPDLHIVARGIDHHSQAKLRRAGADRVELPFQISGRRISSLMVRPSIVDFLDIFARMFGDELMLVQLDVPEDSELCKQSLKELDFRHRTGGLAIMAIFHPDGNLVVHPDGDEIIQGLDRILVLGSNQQIHRFQSEYDVVESEWHSRGIVVREPDSQEDSPS